MWFETIHSKSDVLKQAKKKQQNNEKKRNVEM